MRNWCSEISRYAAGFLVLLLPMNTLDTQTPYGKAVIAVIGIISLTIFYDVFIDDKSTSEFTPKTNQLCEGTPIKVNYPYHGGMLGPHACAPQCDGDVQRFVLYSNGKATQCQKIPGCLDWGEDQGVTCLPPANT